MSATLACLGSLGLSARSFRGTLASWVRYPPPPGRVSHDTIPGSTRASKTAFLNADSRLILSNCLSGVSKHLLNTAFSLLVAYPQTLLPNVHRNAGLLSTLSTTKQWPLLVFSHGLGGGKHMYSQLIRYYAARGYVVLVLQHKDG